jgi:glycosyltransferase involved in cell wall biosynthesis
MHAAPRLLIAAAGFPPTVSGSAILSYTLWGAWEGPLAAVSYRLPGGREDPALVLSGVPVSLVEPWPFGDRRVAAQLDPLAARAVCRTLLAAAARFSPTAIWANWPSTAFLLGAWQAARRLKLPLHVHLHDTWREAYAGRPFPVERAAAWWYEARVLQDAARLFTITDEAQQHYRNKLGVDSEVLPHSVAESDLARPEPPPRPAAGPRVLHFAGSIYKVMNADAVANVCRALDLCRADVRFDCYSPVDAEGLARLGISGSRVRVAFASRSEVASAQADSDILVLPMAFRSTNPTEIRTVFPTKLLDYLVSGRPILVHAPADSWVARAARRDGWGEVVDVPDPAAVATAVDTLLAAPEKARALVIAARQEAARRAAPKVAMALLAQLIGHPTTA